MLPVEYQLKNKELVKLWVEALRSGKYQQITGKFKVKHDTGYSYCSLGVLREIAEPQKIASLIAFAPISVMMPSGKMVSVSTLNDDLHMTFDQIADLLEQTHLKGDDGTTASTEQVTT